MKPGSPLLKILHRGVPGRQALDLARAVQQPAAGEDDIESGGGRFIGLQAASYPRYFTRLRPSLDKAFRSAAVGL
jgi:hypothetical protein